MKSIEDFDLKNMELVHRYLSGKLSLEEEIAFKERLEFDVELKEDLDLAKTYLGFQLEHHYSPDTVSALQEYRFEHIKTDRRATVGENIVTYGLWAVLSTILMILTCIVIIYLMSDNPQ